MCVQFIIIICFSNENIIHKSFSTWKLKPQVFFRKEPFWKWLLIDVTFIRIEVKYPSLISKWSQNLEEHLDIKFDLKWILKLKLKEYQLFFLSFIFAQFDDHFKNITVAHLKLENLSQIIGSQVWKFAIRSLCPLIKLKHWKRKFMT